MLEKISYFMLQLPLSAEMPEGSIIEINKNMLLNSAFYLLNVIILAVVLIFILYRPVKRFMQQRTQRIQNEIETAQTEREEAQELKELYEGKLKDIDREREEVLSQAYKKSMERSDHILKEAREEADHMVTRGLAELELERDNVEDEMKRQLIELSLLTAGKFVEVSMDRKTQDKYIDEALADWEEGIWLD